MLIHDTMRPADRIRTLIWAEIRFLSVEIWQHKALAIEFNRAQRSLSKVCLPGPSMVKNNQPSWHQGLLYLLSPFTWTCQTMGSAWVQIYNCSDYVLLINNSRCDLYEWKALINVKIVICLGFSLPPPIEWVFFVIIHGLCSVY